ncbi:MAG: hypothetical protein Q8R86_09685 [Sulfuricurvum sp.]|nr:hypothetical protein [Sulfuricurvum sp.]
MMCNEYNLVNVVVKWVNYDSSHHYIDRNGYVFKQGFIITVFAKVDDGTVSGNSIDFFTVYCYVYPSYMKSGTFILRDLPMERFGSSRLLNEYDISIFKTFFPSKPVPENHFAFGSFMEPWSSVISFKGSPVSFSYIERDKRELFSYLCDNTNSLALSLRSKLFNESHCHFLLEHNYNTYFYANFPSLSRDDFVFQFKPLNYLPVNFHFKENIFLQPFLVDEVSQTVQYKCFINVDSHYALSPIFTFRYYVSPDGGFPAFPSYQWIYVSRDFHGVDFDYATNLLASYFMTLLNSYVSSHQLSMYKIFEFISCEPAFPFVDSDSLLLIPLENPYVPKVA